MLRVSHEVRVMSFIHKFIDSHTVQRQLQLALADYVWLPHLAARCNHFTSLTCNGFTLFSLFLSLSLTLLVGSHTRSTRLSNDATVRQQTSTWTERRLRCESQSQRQQQQQRLVSFRYVSLSSALTSASALPSCVRAFASTGFASVVALCGRGVALALKRACTVHITGCALLRSLSLSAVKLVLL